ncbi:3-phenylpropionic acid transporter [Xaviernesmea oryzae]|uniref:3-phenylpropionic acid transporter n=1 Tax=Xaviernesmea oryzae TaxID=464029 RepID=A0A1Q9AWN6_9HYPH|nr:MFS transporter [Xaviernesmea oryzae]OLP59850.1 3-phenylpropionic acid transporter [Xaviernesmea oryzae]SEK49087.1 MFS transporter, PPP family, 3-phenylpropionic acid transporter [Xaviernesmea oryzae]
MSASAFAASTRVDAPPPSRFVLRMAFVFAAPLFANGFALPYFPVWLKSLSMSEPEIALILAVPMFLRVFTAPIAGALADRMGERTRLLFVSAVLTLIATLALFVSHAFWFVLIVYTIQGAVLSPYVPIVEAVALSGVRRWGFDYAQMRLWGSVSFIVATLIGGELIARHGGAMVLPAMVTGFCLVIACSFLAPKVGPPRRPSTLSTLTTAPPMALRRRSVQLLIAGIGLVNGSHGMLYAFSAIYWTSAGYSGGQVGLLWSAGVAAEVAMFVFARRILGRISLRLAMLSGCALAMLRWMLFPLDLGFPGYLALQCLHAFSYALMHTGLQNWLVRHVEEAQETAAQGMYFFYTGLFTAVLTFLSGYFFRWYGVHGFLAMSVAAATGLALVLIALRLEAKTARAAQ